MESSWEALDVDDSDLPSLVRSSLSKTLLPCKRSHLSSTTPIPNNKPSSQIQLPSQSPQPQTLNPQTQQPRIQKPKEASTSTTSNPFTIPGPAGAVQSAMHRKALNEVTNNKDGFISTQEYVRRAIQEDGNLGENDDDFKQNPWLCAMDFIGKGQNGGGYSPLESIKNRGRSFDRVDQVVAIIKSLTPNGLGDLTVTLKDPSGTLGASIHRKVLMESEFGKDISVNSVLILHKIAVFSPSPSACYLNITLNNVKKVISKDSGPPSNRQPASPIRPAASLAGMVKKPASVRLRTAERNTDDVRGYSNKKGLENAERQEKIYNVVARRFSGTNSSSCYQRTVLEVESMSRQKAPIEVTIERNEADGADKQKIMADYENQVEDIPSGNLKYGMNASQHASAAKSVGNNPGDGEIESTIGITRQGAQPISKTILPEWTDEQLDELFSTGFDDW